MGRILLFFVLYCIEALVETSLGNYSPLLDHSQYDSEKLTLNDVHELIDEFSYVMDLSLQKDAKILETVPNDFMNLLPKCERLKSCATNVVSSTLRGMHKLYSHITKDSLASGQVFNVSISGLEKKATWASILLDHALRSSFLLSIPNCNETNYYHLAAMFRMHDSLQKLLLRSDPNMGVNCKSSAMFNFTPLHVAIVNRDSRSTALLLSHCADIFSTDAFNRSSLDLALTLFHESGDRIFVNLMVANTRSCLSNADIIRIRSSLPSTDGDADEVGDSSRDAVMSQKPPHRVRSLCSMDTVYASSLNTSFFVEHYMSRRRPLLIKGAARHWRSRVVWKRERMSEEEHGDLEVLVGKIPYAEVFGSRGDRVPLRQFLTYLDNVKAKRVRDEEYIPYYIFDPFVLAGISSQNASSFFDPATNPHPQWLVDALETFSRHPPSHTTGAGKWTCPGKDKSSPAINITKQFYMGPALSGAPHHYHCDSVNTQVRGKKRWFLLPPAHAFYTNTHPLTWLKEHFNESEVDVLTSSADELNRRWSMDDYKRVLSGRGVSDFMDICDQEEGDMVYMPSFYGHSTLNLEESVGVALEFDRGDC